MKLFTIAESQVERKKQTQNKPDPKVDYVVRLFSDGPREYDFLLKVLSLGRDRYWRNSVIRDSRASGNSLILDIACGTGLLTYQFASRGSSVVGVDVTMEMLRRAKDLKDATSNVNFVQARAESLPFRSEVFDGATISLAMRNVSSQLETLGEMQRCTKKGRRVISLDFAKPKSSFFKPFYYFYIFKVLPALGLLISLHWNEIFLYLANSIDRARDPEQIRDSMQKLGLKETRIRRMTHGTTALVSGES